MTDDVTGRPARVCDCTSLRVGDVVHDGAGDQWVFVGYTIRDTGRCAEFAKSVEGLTTGMAKVWQYSVDFYNTFLQKFPDGARYVTGRTTLID